MRNIAESKQAAADSAAAMAVRKRKDGDAASLGDARDSSPPGEMVSKEGGECLGLQNRNMADIGLLNGSEHSHCSHDADVSTSQILT